MAPGDPVEGLPWWLLVGLGVGVLVYATLIALVGGRFGVAGPIVITAVMVHYGVCVLAAFLDRR